MSSKAFDLLKSHIRKPLTLVDVGARWGALDFWTLFGDKARIYCFEADVEEAARLNSENKSPYVEFLPYAVASEPGEVEVVITEGPGCSSIYEPVRALYERYPGCAMMRPARSLTAKSTTLDRFLGDRGVTKIDALKLDTQGSELDILKGAERLIRDCVFLNIEIEFNPLYEGQSLFCDVDRFLRDRGFVLWRLNNLAHYSTGLVASEAHPILLASEPGSYQYVPVDNGQLFWGDAFYVKEAACPTSAASLSVEEAVAGACLVSQWRLWDLAIEMIRKSGAEDLLAQLQRLVPPGAPHPTLAQENEALKTEVGELKAEIAKLRGGLAPSWIGRLFK